VAVVELSFSTLVEHVRTARILTVAVARERGLDEATVDDIRLAVGEACSRAVQAAGADGSALVSVRLLDESDGLTVEVRGPGGPPAPAEADVELAALGIREAGVLDEVSLALMRGLTDHLVLAVDDGTQLVQLRWDD